MRRRYLIVLFLTMPWSLAAQETSSQKCRRGPTHEGEERCGFFLVGEALIYKVVAQESADRISGGWFVQLGVGGMATVWGRGAIGAKLFLEGGDDDGVGRLGGGIFLPYRHWLSDNFTVEVGLGTILFLTDQGCPDPSKTQPTVLTSVTVAYNGWLALGSRLDFRTYDKGSCNVDWPTQQFHGVDWSVGAGIGDAPGAVVVVGLALAFIGYVIAGGPA